MAYPLLNPCPNYLSWEKPAWCWSRFTYQLRVEPPCWCRRQGIAVLLSSCPMGHYLLKKTLSKHYFQVLFRERGIKADFFIGKFFFGPPRVKIPRFCCGNGRSHVILKFQVLLAFLGAKRVKIPRFRCGHCRIM